MPEPIAGTFDSGRIDAVVLRAHQGDVAAFEQIYRASAPAVYALCRRMLGEEREAKELLQDTFVRAWERLTQFRGQSSLDTWLHRVAVNIVLEHLRRSKRDALRMVSTDDDGFGAAPDRVSVDSQMDLAVALDKLPAGSRAVIVLHDIEGYSHEEIADMIGIAAGTSRAQLWRARRALSQVLSS
jgi:RNA polymerase sigma-70 factor, ECF subfamily